MLKRVLPVLGVLAILAVIAAACFIIFALFMETGQCFTRACQQELTLTLSVAGVGSSLLVLGVVGYAWYKQRPWNGPDRRRSERREGTRRKEDRLQVDDAWNTVDEPRRRKSD